MFLKITIDFFFNYFFIFCFPVGEERVFLTLILFVSNEVVRKMMGPAISMAVLNV